MIDPKFIDEHFEEFNIYPSHEEIFKTILYNIETERRFIIAGETFGGKSFFCKKMALKISEKLKISMDKIKIIDFPLKIIELMLEKEVKGLNPASKKEFLQNYNLNEILKLNQYDLIVLDEINSTLFDEFFNFRLNLENNQIIFKVINHSVRGLFYRNKSYHEGLGYKFYDLGFPTEDERIQMIELYIKLSDRELKNYENDLIAESRNDIKKFIFLFL